MSMNYTLAKELKDAGFPQSLKEGSPLYDKEGMLCYSVREVDTAADGGDLDYGWTKCPTLEELIEACGKDFGSLEKDCIDSWAAHRKSVQESFGGPTPTEAVARLWLALQEHNNTNEVRKCESCLAGFSKDDVLGSCTCL